MLGQISGPSLGCVLKLGYRRPLDDTAFLGEIQWDEISDHGEAGSNNIGGGAGVSGGGEKGQNKRKGNVVCCSLFPSSLVKHFFLVKKSNKNQPAEDPVVKTHTKTSSLSKVKGKMLR